jgi:hypothetical protein
MAGARILLAVPIFGVFGLYRRLPINSVAQEHGPRRAEPFQYKSLLLRR